MGDATLKITTGCVAFGILSMPKAIAARHRAKATRMFWRKYGQFRSVIAIDLSGGRTRGSRYEGAFRVTSARASGRELSWHVL